MKRAPHELLRAIANQPGDENTSGAQRTLIPWTLIEEARKLLGPNWKYADIDLSTGKPKERLTSHPIPDPNFDKPLPRGMTCEDCTGFAMCRTLRNISGFTTCTSSQGSFTPRRGRRRYSGRLMGRS